MTESEQIEKLARELYNRADPTGIFAAADYGIQAHFRREAARKLQQKAYRGSNDRQSLA